MRDYDPRDVLSRDLDLPRGPDRELVRDRDRDYRLSGSDTGTLSTVGAFRVVPERDLNDSRIAACDVGERDSALRPGGSRRTRDTAPAQYRGGTRVVCPRAATA